MKYNKIKYKVKYEIIARQARFISQHTVPDWVYFWFTDVLNKKYGEISYKIKYEIIQ